MRHDLPVALAMAQGGGLLEKLRQDTVTFQKTDLDFLAVYHGELAAGTRTKQTEDAHFSALFGKWITANSMKV